MLTPNGDGKGDRLAITFQLAAPATVRLRVLRDGKWVATPFTGPLQPGPQTLTWDGARLVGRTLDGAYTANVDATDAIGTANIVDLVEAPNGSMGINAGGTNHHVAFRVKDDVTLMEFREKIASSGFNITGKIDRNYFYSLYFRERGGVLFELASDNPGFAVDELVNELGTHLMLPAQYEESRKKIQALLPELQQ